MKHFLTFFLALLLTFTALPATAEDEFVNIQQLREQTDDHWTQTYVTQWRDVAIDTPITIPDADNVPIAVIIRDLNITCPTADESGWDEANIRDGAMIAARNVTLPKSVNGRRISKNATAKGNWYSGFSDDRTYVPMCSTSFGEVLTLVKQSLTGFGFDPDDFLLDNPKRVWAHHRYFADEKADALPGYLLFQCYQKLYGLPLLGHIYDAVCDHYHGESRMGEFYDFFRLTGGYDGVLGDLDRLFFDNFQVTDQLAQDVPLCSFGKVQSTVEADIRAGHIRKVFEMRLGYMLFNEPGVYRNASSIQTPEVHFYLKPVWVVKCLYVKNPRGKLRTPIDGDERNTLDYRELFIDAQTGEPLRESKAFERCECKGFLSWQDVGGGR